MFSICYFAFFVFLHIFNIFWIAKYTAVADPGCDLRGGVDFVNGGRGGRKSLKVLMVEIKVIPFAFLAIFLIKLCFKLIASEEKIEKKKRFGHKKNMGPRPLGGGARRVQYLVM